MTRGSSVIRMSVAHFPPATAAVFEVRASTVHTLMAWSLDPAAVEVAELVVCELASNAAKASRPDDVMAIRLTATNGEVLIEVWDGNDSAPRVTHADEHSEDGRGLLLVDALSSRWSWHYAKTGGKVVWAVLPAMMQPVRPWAEESIVPLGQRAAEPVPDPMRPVAFEEDPTLLRRVADRLRALDDWHLPHAEAALPRTRTPRAAVARMTAGRVC